MSKGRSDNNLSAQDALEIVNRMIAEKKARLEKKPGTEGMDERVYTDEPILYRGSRLREGASGQARPHAPVANRQAGQAPSHAPTSASASAPASAPAHAPTPAPTWVPAQSPTQIQVGGVTVHIENRTASKSPAARGAWTAESLRGQADWRRAGRTPAGDSQPPVRATSAPAVPERITEMKKIASRPEMREASFARLFYEQARFMEDYRDDYGYTVAFYRYFPTYRDMSDEQLRGYFAWRTRLRDEGLDQAAGSMPTSYAFLYLYELLCGVGVESVEDGLRKLEQVAHHDGPMRDRVALYLDHWISDYVIYHGLDTTRMPASVTNPRDGAFGTLLRMRYDVLLDDAQRAALLNAGVASDEEAAGSLWSGKTSFLLGRLLNQGAPLDEEVFEALLACSNKSVAGSRFFKEHPDESRRVVCGVVRKLVSHCDRRRKTGFFEGLFGEVISIPYTMFRNSPFYDPERHPDVLVRTSDVEWYACTKGRWFRARLCNNASESSDLGSVLRAVDAAMRVAWDYPHPLARRDAPKYLARIIDEEIALERERQQSQQVPPLRIDLTALGGIRDAAARTRERLLVDEEREETGDAPAAIVRPDSSSSGPEAPVPAAPVIAATPVTSRDSAESATPVPPAEAAQALALEDDELLLLRRLVAGEAVTSKTWDAARSLEMTADSLNEKLFDLVGDTVAEFVGDELLLVEDYRADVETVAGLG